MIMIIVNYYYEIKMYLIISARLVLVGIASSLILCIDRPNPHPSQARRNRVGALHPSKNVGVYIQKFVNIIHK